MTRMPSGANSGARIDVSPSAMANAALPKAMATISLNALRSISVAPAQMWELSRCSLRARAEETSIASRVWRKTCSAVCFIAFTRNS